MRRQTDRTEATGPGPRIHGANGLPPWCHFPAYLSGRGEDSELATPWKGLRCLTLVGASPRSLPDARLTLRQRLRRSAFQTQVYEQASAAQRMTNPLAALTSRFAQSRRSLCGRWKKDSLGGVRRLCSIAPI